MKGPRNKTVLITGSSSGIGYELARLFAKDRYGLVLVGTNASRLKQCAESLRRTYDVRVETICKDLAAPEVAPEIARELSSASIQIDVLVNNAGFNVFGTFDATDLQAELRLLQLHIVTLTALTKLLLPGMLLRGFGRVLNVASTASFMPGVPLNAVYCASKSYVLSFTEGIAADLAATGVTATALCPGATKTAFIERAGMARSNMFSGSLMSPARVALAGYRGMLRGKRVVVPGLRNKCLVFSARLFPRRLMTDLGRILMGERHSLWARILRIFTFLDFVYRKPTTSEPRGAIEEA